ncbi:MAG: hypothetical protein WBW06_13020, partial [Xanthobacteraceae bacterium]
MDVPKSLKRTGSESGVGGRATEINLNPFVGAVGSPRSRSANIAASAIQRGMLHAYQLFHSEAAPGRRSRDRKCPRMV